MTHKLFATAVFGQAEQAAMRELLTRGAAATVHENAGADPEGNRQAMTLLAVWSLALDVLDDASPITVGVSLDAAVGLLGRLLSNVAPDARLHAAARLAKGALDLAELYTRGGKQP